jgi:uncharacterized phage protein (TIGR01671 family)
MPKIVGGRFMDERFKLKAWDKIEKKMFDVAMIDFCGNGYIWDESNFDVDKQRQTAHDLKNCVLLQCTGLKDKSGKLIYEDYLVKFKIPTHYGNDEGIGLVKYINGCFRVYDKFHMPTLNSAFMEIIGNKYENPELLDEVL